MNEYEMNSTVKCEVTFRDTDGALYNPTLVTAFVEKPDGSIVVIVTITHPSTGYYYFYYTSDSEGEYIYQFTGTTGSITSVSTQYFSVLEYAPGTKPTSSVEAVLRNRLAPLLTIGGIDVDLGSAISWAVRKSGGSTASILTATNSEIQACDIDEVLDQAELRTLMNVLQNTTTVDWKAGPISEKSSQLVDWIKDRIEKITASLSKEVVVGYIDLNIVEVG